MRNIFSEFVSQCTTSWRTTIVELIELYAEIGDDFNLFGNFKFQCIEIQMWYNQPMASPVEPVIVFHGR